MGFWGKLLSSGTALNRLAKTCDECLNCLMRYRISFDKYELFKAAWLFNFGIVSSLEKWNWNPISTKINIPNHPELGRLLLNQVIMIILSNLTNSADQAGETETISDILDGGISYHAYEYLIAQNLKSKLKP